MAKTSSQTHYKHFGPYFAFQPEVKELFLQGKNSIGLVETSTQTHYKPFGPCFAFQATGRYAWSPNNTLFRFRKVQLEFNPKLLMQILTSFDHKGYNLIQVTNSFLNMVSQWYSIYSSKYSCASFDFFSNVWYDSCWCSSSF